ncbi:MAG: MoaD/ThiS family protein [Spirochaetia bacterium]|nr:MoaD/ThiS family protein [Spirochaetia bacterium]
MRIFVNTFGPLKDYFGQTITIELENKASIIDLFNKLVQINPKGELLLKNCQWAVNNNIIYGKNYELNDKQEVFVMPPFSGG